MAERTAVQAKYNNELIAPILSFSSEGHSMRPLDRFRVRVDRSFRRLIDDQGWGCSSDPIP